jgi:hypothetical protein
MSEAATVAPVCMSLAKAWPVRCLWRCQIQYGARDAPAILGVQRRDDYLCSRLSVVRDVDRNGLCGALTDGFRCYSSMIY